MQTPLTPDLLKNDSEGQKRGEKEKEEKENKWEGKNIIASCTNKIPAGSVERGRKEIPAASSAIKE
jgi:hypothetical protein